MDPCFGGDRGGKQNEEMNRYNRHQDEILVEVEKQAKTAAAVWLCSGSPSSALSHTHTHKSQGGLSLHDRAKL